MEGWPVKELSGHSNRCPEPMKNFEKEMKMQKTLFKNQAASTAANQMRNFMLIWIGQTVSLVGSGMTCFAQSVYVYTNLGGTITNLMLLAAAAQLPGILISPLAGILVDRWNRRWVMIISDTVAAVATLALRMLVMSPYFQLWQMYLLVIVISVANHILWPALFATIPVMVPKERIGYANGLVQIARSFSGIAAPFMAGLAVTAFSLQGVILFDFVSYVVATVTLLIVRIPQPVITRPVQTAKGSLVREALYGFAYLFERRGLFSLLILFAVANFLFANLSILFMPLALTIGNATMLGSVMSVGGISMLVGSLIMGAWGGPKRRVYGVLGFMFLQGIALLFIGMRPSIPFLLGAYVLFTFASPFVNANSGAIWNTKVAQDVQGRVLAASSMVSTTALELGYLSSGPLADNIFEPLLAVNGPLAGSVGRIIGTGPGRGIGFMFIIMGVICVTATIVGLLYPRLRRLDIETPDTIPDARQAGLQPQRQAVGMTLRQIDLISPLE